MKVLERILCTPMLKVFSVEMPIGSQIIDILYDKVSGITKLAFIVLQNKPTPSATKLRQFAMIKINEELATHNEDGLLVAVWEFRVLLVAFSGAHYYVFENVKN